MVSYVSVYILIIYTIIVPSNQPNDYLNWSLDIFDPQLRLAGLSLAEANIARQPVGDAAEGPGRWPGRWPYVTWGEAGGWSETCQTGGMVTLVILVFWCFAEQKS